MRDLTNGLVTRDWSDDELISALMLTLDFDAPWTGYLRERLDTAISLARAA